MITFLFFTRLLMRATTHPRIQESVSINTDNRLVSNTTVTKEMELLWCLASNPGKAFSRNQLLETIWGYSYYGDTRTVDTHIKRIRQKLNIPSDAKWDITTIWGVGYKFEVKEP